MTADHAATVDSLAATLVGGADRLGADERAVAVALYRLLAEGRPVAPRELAHAANVREDFVRAALASWSDVHHDADRIVAFWGLDLRPTRHRFAVGAARLTSACLGLGT